MKVFLNFTLCRITYLGLILLVFVRCSPSNNKQIKSISDETKSTLITLTTDIKSSLNYWGLNANITLSATSDSIDIGIIYLDDSCYLDSASNNIIANLLLFDNYSILKSWNLININLIFSQYNDINKITFNEESKAQVKKIFSDELFHSAVSYSLHELNYKDIVLFGSITKYLLENMGLNSDNNDYWKNLKKYCDYFKFQRTNSIVDAEVFLFGVSYLKLVPLEGISKDYYKVFIPIIEGTGIDAEILDKGVNINERLKERQTKKV